MKGGSQGPGHHLRQDNRLQLLGFEEGELEMFFDGNDISEYQLVRKYLDIAQHPPYNLNWDSEETAIRAPYTLGIYKTNGEEYTKHDIAQDTLTYFYDEAERRRQAEGRGQAEGGRGAIRKKKRRTKKHRSSKRKQSRRYRRRH
jgi:hypothetical protein